MSNSASKKLALVKKLINQFKLEEALNYIKEIEQLENRTNEDILKTHVYKARIQYNLGEFQNALKIAEELYQQSQKMDKPLFLLDALSLKESIFYNFGSPSKAFYETLEEHEKLFNSIPRVGSSEFQEREAILLMRKGTREFNKGDLNLALDYYEKSLKLNKQNDPNSSYIYIILMAIAYVFQVKGELNLALEYTKKAISLLPEGEYFTLMLLKGGLYRNLGGIYWRKGDLDNALEYLIRDLEICKKLKITPKPYLLVIYILIAKNDFAQAHYYLEECKKDTEKPDSDFYYQVARALILKISPRLQDHFEAITILKKFLERQSAITNLTTQDLMLISLSDLYLEEFRLSNQLAVLDDIKPLIDLLQRNAKLQKSYFSLSNVKLLQAKIALLQVNMVEARKLLTEAQQIADEHGLGLLADEISREHDRLLEELKLWESIKKEKASIAERMKLASIDPVMERLHGKRAIEVPEVSVEEPILLIIMDKSGVTYFNHSFIGEWDFDDLFSSFMSAFNSFSGEIFSNSIDRVKIADNTILINPIEPFLACYVIKGQSYPAQQKLTRFSSAIKASPEIWEALNKATKTSEMLELDNPPSLGSTVKEIFIN